MSDKILVIGPSWIGDMVMAQSLFMVLKEQSPQATIDVLAPAWSRPLIERMPEVRKGVLMPVGHGQLKLKERFLLAKSLRKERYDQAVILPNSLKSALIPWWAKITKRRGFRGEMRYGLLNELRILDKKKLPMTVQRFVALGLNTGEPLPDPIPQPKLLINTESVNSTLQKMGISYPRKKLLALCPGAEFGRAKQWPAEYFATVAKDRILKGWNVWLFGSERDYLVSEKIIQQLAGLENSIKNLVGRTILEQTIDLMSLVTVTVSNDSGLMHVAAALNCDLVAIYGSSNPKFTPPLSPCAQILYLDLECSPCYQRECPLSHYHCLKKLLPNQVVDAIDILSK